MSASSFDPMFRRGRKRFFRSPRDLRIAQQGQGVNARRTTGERILCQFSAMTDFPSCANSLRNLAHPTGFEPVTSAFGGMRPQFSPEHPCLAYVGLGININSL